MKTRESNQLHISSLLSHRDAGYCNTDLEVQKFLIEKMHNGAACKITSGCLMTKLNFSHKLWRVDYNVGILYFGNNLFEARILNRSIPNDPDIHVNGDGSLCLWFAPHFHPYFKICLATDVIIWVRDWIHNFELYKINKGKWESEFVPHPAPIAA